MTTDPKPMQPEQPDVKPFHAPLELRRWAQAAFGTEHALSPVQLAIGGAVLDSVWSRGIAERLRQATEGWDREWLVNHPPYGGADTFVTEGLAREEAARVGRPVFVRLVGPWEPAPVSGPDASASGRPQGSAG